MKKLKEISYYVEGIKTGNRFILSEAITLVESSHSTKKSIGLNIIESLGDKNRTSIRIGITGSPGVGKSTFLDSFGTYLLEQNKSIAVLAIDPASQLTKGSILGDKTRMERLVKSEKVYIRPSSAGLSLGGLNSSTMESIMLCEAAGYDIILVETVGVGQSETMLSQVVDVFLYLLQPGSGDEIQGIKRGIMELADILIINKADGVNLEKARISKKQYTSALKLLHHRLSSWKPSVVNVSSLEDRGMDDVWKIISRFLEESCLQGYFDRNRKSQILALFDRKVINYIERFFEYNDNRYSYIISLKKQIQEGNLDAIGGLKGIEELFRKA